MMRRSLTVLALFLTAIGVSVPGVTYARDVVQRPAEIRSGSCVSLGDPVVPLENVVAPGGDQAGPGGATPVEQSVTVVPQLLPDLLAGGYVVVVDKSIEEPDTPAACGVVGGVVAEDGTLAVGISPMEGSRLDGVAYFAPKRDDSGTSVTLLLVDNRAEEANAPAGPVGMAGEDGTITIGGATENTDSVTLVEDGSGDVPAGGEVAAPAPATGDQDGLASVDSASGANGTDGQDGADGQDGKEGKPEKVEKGERGANDGNGGNAGNDGAAAAGSTGGDATG